MTQPDHSRMGKLLLAFPCQKTIQPVGWLDRSKALVASPQTVAEHRLEGLPTKRLRTECKLVSLVALIPSLQIAHARS